MSQEPVPASTSRKWDHKTDAAILYHQKIVNRDQQLEITNMSRK
jgi:hypothetical protein